MNMPGTFCLMIAAASLTAMGQPEPGQPPAPGMMAGRQAGPGGPGMMPMGPGGPGPGGPMRGPMQPGRPMPGGRWWTNPEMVQKLGLTAEQKQKIDSIFQQSRLKLIDLNASLRKEEAILEPLLESEKPDEAKVVAQIDRIAQARGELEKANARMLLGFRAVLTQDQWKKLQAERPQGPARPRAQQGPPGAPAPRQ
ncbi:MAG: Spy/CpxP family protein refolding chaperone [Acidobacteria bacterium]|nr:Spy/CpxP family protein refolding chaperone [Acidobacteriota bacterium]